MSIMGKIELQNSQTFLQENRSKNLLECLFFHNSCMERKLQKHWRERNAYADFSIFFKLLTFSFNNTDRKGSHITHTDMQFPFCDAISSSFFLQDAWAKDGLRYWTYWIPTWRRNCLLGQSEFTFQILVNDATAA